MHIDGMNSATHNRNEDEKQLSSTALFIKPFLALVGVRFSGLYDDNTEWNGERPDFPHQSQRNKSDKSSSGRSFVMKNFFVGNFKNYFYLKVSSATRKQVKLGKLRLLYREPSAAWKYTPLSSFWAVCKSVETS